jgi:hypothetical protein
VEGNVTIEIQGALSARPAACNGAGPVGNSGPVITLGLAASSRAVTQQSSATVQVIDSAAVFVALPIAANQRSTVLYLRSLDLSPIGIRLTFEVSAVAILPVAGGGSVMLEAPPDDRISLVEVQGQGRISWLAGGGIV